MKKDQHGERSPCIIRYAIKNRRIITQTVLNYFLTILGFRIECSFYRLEIFK